MNLAELENKLIAAGRAHPPGDKVPYAFEKRVMALISGQPALDRCGLWARALWRAAAPCVALMLLLSAWSYFSPANPTPTADLSQAFENAVLAAADPDSSAETLW